MKILQVLSPAILTLILSTIKVHSAQVAVYGIESDGGSDTLSYIVGVVCDDSVDYDSVDLDALCELPDQGTGNCTVNACGTSYTGTSTGVDNDGCGNSANVNGGSIGSDDYPGSSACQDYSTCLTGAQGV